MTRKEQQDIDRKLKVLKYADTIKNISKACRYFGISRETFYQWKRAYLQKGEKGLINSKPCPENPTLRVPADIEEKIIYLRTTYHLGPQRISWYLMRYHHMKVSSSGVYSVLKRNTLNRLPTNQRKRSLKAFKRYEKQVPGHRIQVDVKFLDLQTKQGGKIRRYQYTAIDDATRARIHTVQTDNGHEFQSQFHWHCEDLGIKHVYIKPRSHHLNGKVERSHGTDQQEFYQLINFTDDIDICKKLEEWEKFYNCHRPHSALKGKIPFEVLKEKLS